MIAIIGVSEDDLLYFKAKLAITGTSLLGAGGGKVYLGRLFDQDVCLLATGESNLRSAVSSSALLSRYEPYLCFSIGPCYSFATSLRRGDLFIADRIYLAGVDFSRNRQAGYGQIPGEPPFFMGDSELSGKAKDACYLISPRYVQRGYLLSGDEFFDRPQGPQSIVDEHFSKEGGIRAYDTHTGGVAYACRQRGIPLVSLQVISYEIGKSEQRFQIARETLSAMPTLGRVITQLLSDGAE